MIKQKYLINLNHVTGINSFVNFSEIVDGFFISSAHIKKDKMLKLINSNISKEVKNIYVDFFHYISTIDISKNNTERFKREINERLINNIFENKNLISLFLLKKDDEAIKLIENSIIDFIKLISESNSDIKYSLPLPIFGRGEIYLKLWTSYLNIFKKYKKELSKYNLFINLVLRSGNNVEKKFFFIIKEIVEIFNITDIFISYWRMDDILLTDDEEKQKIINCIDIFLKWNKNIYLNYLHNEFLYFAEKFKYKSLNFVFGTYEQTKILSPKIRWMNENENMQRFDNKIFFKDYGLFLKQKRMYELKTVIDEFDYNNEIETFKRNDTFKFNTIQMKEILDRKEEIDTNIYVDKLSIIWRNPYWQNLFNKALKYKMSDYILLYELIDEL